jgi:uncharacterized protein (DUF2062 family)
MTRSVREGLRRIVHVEGTPHRIALAFGVGVFIGLSPIPPVLFIHTMVAMVVAYSLRLTPVAVLTGTWLNTFFTIPFTYMAGTLLGCALLDQPLQGPEGLEWSGGGGLSKVVSEIRPYVWPFVVGNTVLSLACGALAYVALRLILERRRLARAAAAPVTR